MNRLYFPVHTGTTGHFCSADTEMTNKSDYTTINHCRMDDEIQGSGGSDHKNCLEEITQCGLVNECQHSEGTCCF
jgi:hypothetical protein